MEKVERRGVSLILFLFTIATAAAETCQDSSKLCEKYKEYCYGNILKACKWTCDLCPSTSYEDRCKLEESGCEQLCSSVGGRISCQCLKGYLLNSDRKTCSDINECSMDPNPCTYTAKPNCINTRGSYFCSDKETCSSKKGFANYYKSSECCQTKLGKCGQNSANAGRIIGGNTSVAGRWPWMGRIEVNEEPICGVTLISLRWGLTAAHCLRHPPHAYTLIFGDIRRDTMIRNAAMYKQTRLVEKMVIHEEFIRPRHDIALLLFDSPVVLTDFVSPVCLPEGEVPAPGWKCWAMGYGTTGKDVPHPVKLMEVDLEITLMADCATAYAPSDVITEDMICAGYKEGGKDTCYGDSGGPLVCQRCSSCAWYVAGVTSFGRGCALPGLYGVYTDVAAHEDWIRLNAGMKSGGCGGDENAVLLPWSPFTRCNTTCGQEGYRERIRECNGPAAQPRCVKSKVEVEKCIGKCAYWGEWGAWETCTNSCAGGTQVRNRECKDGNVGDDGCQGDQLENQECNTDPCPTAAPPPLKCYTAELDKASNCYSVMDLCDVEKYKPFMESNCQMTCCMKMLAKESLARLPCKDSDGSKELCEMYANNCEDQAYGTYFMDNCKKTCGLC